MSETATPTDPSSAPSPAARWRLALLGVMALVLVASVACFAWLATTREISFLGLGGEQSSQQQDREDAMAQASQFLLRLGTYGPDLLAEDGTMPDYRERITEVITPKFEASFTQEVNAAEQLVAEAQQTREATVFGTGVAAIDEDTATVLVAGAFTDRYADGEPLAPSAFRLEVMLVKIDGQWLVDDFSPLTLQRPPQPVPPTDGESGPGTEVPEDEPTEEEPSEEEPSEEEPSEEEPSEDEQGEQP